MVLNLVSVPLEDVKNSWNYIKEKLKKHEKFEAFVSYYEKTYVRRRMQEYIELSCWNCHTTVINFLPRTTNGVESLHKSSNMSCDVSHPDFGTFLI